MGECNRSAYNSTIGSIVRRPKFQPSAILLESRLQYLQARALYVNLFRKQPVLRFYPLNCGRFVRRASHCTAVSLINQLCSCESVSAALNPQMTQNPLPTRVHLTFRPEHKHVAHSDNSHCCTRRRRCIGKLSFADLPALHPRPLTRSMVCPTLLSGFAL